MSEKIKLEELHKLSKYGKHISGFFHNLNTPLMGISGRLELLSFTQPDLKGLSQMTDQLDRIESIMNNFTKIYENDKNESESAFNINDLIEQIDKFFYTNLQYKHKLNVSKELENLPAISINISHLQNFLINLINFYLDIIPKNGDFIITTKEINGENLLTFIGKNVSVDNNLIERLNVEDKESFEDNEVLFFMKYFLNQLELDCSFILANGDLVVKISF